MLRRPRRMSRPNHDQRRRGSSPTECENPQRGYLGDDASSHARLLSANLAGLMCRMRAVAIEAQTIGPVRPSPRRSFRGRRPRLASRPVHSRAPRQSCARVRTVTEGAVITRDGMRSVPGATVYSPLPLREGQGLRVHSIATGSGGKPKSTMVAFRASVGMVT